jgi:hypothetical protein
MSKHIFLSISDDRNFFTPLTPSVNVIKLLVFITEAQKKVFALSKLLHPSLIFASKTYLVMLHSGRLPALFISDNKEKV